MASITSESSKLSFSGTHRSIKPDIQLSVEVPDPSVSSLIEGIRELREKSNEQLSVWVEREKEEGGKTGEVRKKRKVSEGEEGEGSGSENEETGQLDADIDNILSKHANSDSKAKKVKSD